MKHKRPYWNGTRPSDGKRWRDAEEAALLDLDVYGDDLYRMYRRYVKQWNDIELDHARELSEHTFRVLGARVVGSSGKFILTFDADRNSGWILDVTFRRGFRQYYPGLSTGLNALRSLADISRAALHWRGDGRKSFDSWLKLEKLEHASSGEWSEYKT